ncbi:GAF domain-containing sensor histidine kinase [Luteolibacter luteus]|uniref:histidine kinase n=1 Tax=Luteolibacter luteus TaxID=2728835 RepID=A0A858RMU3_9BACT|nr:GAF domain-containing sensor histidine kinase [Luteolibacter luteus]QJE97901.1 GAF domain-containing sensor histidine kinase [Luteolibacter luteus]
MEFRPYYAGPGRVESLKSSGLLDGLHGIDFDSVTKLAAKAANAPTSLVSLIDDRRQVFVGACGLPDSLSAERQTPLSYSFCQHAVQLRRPLVICDARKETLVADNPAVEEFGVIAYLGFPILGSGRHLYGALCVIDSQPRQWTEEEIGLVREFASIVASLIEQHLARTYQKNAVDVLLHDLKSPLSSIRMGADLLHERADDLPPPLDKMVRALKVSADKAVSMVTSLGLRDRVSLRCDDLYGTTESVASRFRPLAGRKGMAIRVSDPGLRIPLDCPDWVISEALENLLTNAVNFSETGEIRVGLKRVGEAAIIDVQDEGPGFHADDYDKVFRPYSAFRMRPAGADPSAGIGLSIAKKLLEAEGGTIVLLSQAGESAAFRITVPVRSRE